MHCHRSPTRVSLGLFAAEPNIDIRVYVDQQEYISNYGDDKQKDKRESCLANATSENAIFDCNNKSFEDTFELNRDGTQLEDLREEIESSDWVPLVFDSIALSWDEVTSLKRLIRDNCPQVNSDDFRRNPQSHKKCPRLHTKLWRRLVESVSGRR